MPEMPPIESCMKRPKGVLRVDMIEHLCEMCHRFLDVGDQATDRSIGIEVGCPRPRRRRQRWLRL